MDTNKPAKVDTATPKPLTLFEGSFGFPWFRRMSRDLDYMFHRFGMERPFFEATPSAWAPDVEILQKNNMFILRADVPGLKKEDITVEVTDDNIILHGERKHEKEEKGEGYYRSERTYGSFYRAVPLPEGAKVEGAKATVHDGVLEVTMPLEKVEEKKRRLEIKEVPVEKATKAA